MLQCLSRSYDVLDATGESPSSGIEVSTYVGGTHYIVATIIHTKEGLLLQVPLDNGCTCWHPCRRFRAKLQQAAETANLYPPVDLAGEPSKFRLEVKGTAVFRCCRFCIPEQGDLALLRLDQVLAVV